MSLTFSTTTMQLHTPLDSISVLASPMSKEDNYVYEKYECIPGPACKEETFDTNTTRTYSCRYGEVFECVYRGIQRIGDLTAEDNRLVQPLDVLGLLESSRRTRSTGVTTISTIYVHLKL
jgi:hypothetical protein